MSHAEQMELQQLFTLRQGLTYGRPQHQSSSGEIYRYLQLSTLRDGRIDVSGALKEERLKEEVAQPHVPRPGALVVSLRTPGLPLAVVDRELPGYVVSNNLAMLTLRREHRARVRPQFVALVLQSRSIQERIEPLYTGIQPVSLPIKLLRQVSIGIPPLAVQDALLGVWRANRQEEEAFRRITELRRNALESHLDPYARGIEEDAPESHGRPS